MKEDLDDDEDDPTGLVVHKDDWTPDPRDLAEHQAALKRFGGEMPHGRPSDAKGITCRPMGRLVADALNARKFTKQSLPSREKGSERI